MLLCAFPFSLFRVRFFLFYSFWQIPSRRCPSGQPAAIFICNYLYGEHLGTGLSSTASAGTTGRLAPFNNSRWLSGIHACANGLHKIRRDCQRLQEMQQQQQQQSVDCNRYLSCFSGELSLLFLASNSDMVGVPL